MACPAWRIAILPISCRLKIVNDVRVLHDTTWVRRALRNARYSESMRPNVPSTLLELLSHQNFRDMEYANGPTFSLRRQQGYL